MEDEGGELVWFNEGVMDYRSRPEGGSGLRRRTRWLLERYRADLELAELPTIWEAACMPSTTNRLLGEYRRAVLARWEARALGREARAGSGAKRGRL